MWGPVGRGDAGRTDRVLSTGVIPVLIALIAVVALVIVVSALFIGTSWIVGAVTSIGPDWLLNLLYFVMIGIFMVGFFIGLFRVISRIEGPY